MPVYRDEQGLALGVQLTAAKGREDLLLQIAQEMEEASFLVKKIFFSVQFFVKTLSNSVGLYYKFLTTSIFIFKEKDIDEKRIFRRY